MPALATPESTLQTSETAHHISSPSCPLACPQERSVWGRLDTPEQAPVFTYPALGTGHRTGHVPNHLKRLAVRSHSDSLKNNFFLTSLSSQNHLAH